MSRRDDCGPLIARVIAETGRDDMKVLRRALRDAYPWGVRKMHPYKIWCDEVRRQLGLKPQRVFGQKQPVRDDNTPDLFA